jgi:hypothetical protein
MRTIVAAALAAGLLIGHAAWGQTDLHGLEEALHGKPMGLKSYSADPVARYSWIGGKLLPATVELHGLEAFFTDAVRQKGGKIFIDGQSSTLVRNEGKIAAMGKTPMTLEIDLQGANPAEVIPQLQAAIFFPNLGAALQGLPEFVADMLPFASDGVYQSTCHCTRIFQDGKWVKLEEGDPKLAGSKIIQAATADPALNQKAMDAKAAGALTLIYYVADTGRVDEVWLAKPLDPGLDESVARTGRGNVFRPAMYDGKPVGSVLIQSMSFNAAAPASAK